MKSLQDQSHFGATGKVASLQSIIQDSESVQDGLINWQVDDYCTRTDRRAIKNRQIFRVLFITKFGHLE